MARSRSGVARWFVMVVGLAAVLAGCSHTATPATTTTTTVPATTTTLAPTTSTTIPATSTTTSTQPSAPGPCKANQVRLTALEGTGAAGSIFSPVGVVNTSKSSCTLYGRALITLIGGAQGAQPAPLSTTVNTTGQGPAFTAVESRLTLIPSSAAHVGFMVQSSDVPSDGEQTCPVVSSMKVILPGISTPFTIKETFTACGGPTISVSAIVRAADLSSS